jgi:hypothetical protein
MKFGLEGNTETAKFMVVLSPECRTNHNLLIANKSFENVENSKYVGPTVANHSCAHEEIKSRLNSGNVCCLSDQSILSFRLLSRNIRIKI